MIRSGHRSPNLLCHTIEYRSGEFDDRQKMGASSMRPSNRPRTIVMAGKLDELAHVLDGVGLAFRGAFHPVPEDGVPAFADGAPTRTVALLGWTGGDQWPVFAASTEARDGLPDPLNRWSKRLGVRGAARLHPAAL